MAGIEMLAGTIREDMVMRLPRQNKKQREGLSLLEHFPIILVHILS